MGKLSATGKKQKQQKIGCSGLMSMPGSWEARRTPVVNRYGIVPDTVVSVRGVGAACVFLVLSNYSIPLPGSLKQRALIPLHSF